MLKIKELIKVIILSLMLMLTISNVSSAEEIFISESYSYALQENEVIRDAEDKAINLALRKVFVTLGSKIKSYTTVIDKVLAEDKIERFSSATAKIQKKIIEPGFDQYNRLVINVSIEAIIDTADIDKWEELEIKEQERGFDSNDIVVMDLGKDLNWKYKNIPDFEKFHDEITKAFFDGTYYEVLNNDLEKANVLAGYLLDANYNLGCLYKGDIAYIRGDINSSIKYWKQAMYNYYTLTAVNRIICYYFNKKNYNEAKKLMLIEKDEDVYGYNNWYHMDNGMRIFDDQYEGMTIDMRSYILSGEDYPSERMFRR